ncbi:hypothetical protein HYH03_007971 [Edaphochlamys debaryana]|uniref:Protein kinase domain-containing protein n=1 Tax=Edaphochlamys debaryana TaxID=47281 RepID=A0A835Y324_9CHLO|nr:hypothetical protein HYH03_007971 [Edaphochlamys debaryana]|eukprot:KAG2493748.1 hypothetical protein HYH03_007971 [Edaphochlamys debaryana]
MASVRLLFLVLLTLASRRTCAQTSIRSVASGAELVAALAENSGPAELVVTASAIALSSALFNSYAPALVLDRNVTIRSPSASPLHRLSLGFLRGWIRLSPGCSLTFRWLLFEDFSDGSNAGAGITLVEPGAGVTEVIIDRSVFVVPRCFSAAFLSTILKTLTRVDYYPGAHNLSVLPGVPDVLRAAGTAGDGDGRSGPPGPCIADSSAPLLQRCWAQALKPGLLLSNIVNRQTQAVALCVELATQACVETYGGPTECLMSGFEAYMAQRLNGSGSGDGIGTSPEPQVPGSNGGTVSAASNSGGAEGLSRAQIAVVVCASTAGALVLLAVAVVGSVWLHRNWRLKRQPNAADNDSSGQATLGPCAGREASGGGGGAGMDVGASSGSSSAKGSLKPRFEESSLDSTVAAAGVPTTAAATRYLMPDLEAPAVLPASPCHAPFVSIVDEVTCQPPGQPPPPPEPASPGEGVIAGDVTPAGSVVSARAEERQPGEDEVMLLQRVLGMGSFGKVYEGLYRGERVAVKVFTSFMGPGFPSHLAPVGALQSLVREVEVLGRVSHPNVVRLLAACVMPPRMGLVLELMETSLSRLMYKTRPPDTPLLPMDEVLTIATHVAAGLSYLHPTIVHRDLKPANVLVSGYGTPQLVAKLADFGLSRLRSTTVATENPEAGTAAYLAPECYDIDNCYVTHDADMYSFGVLLWEMLMGREPWQGLPVMAIAMNIQLHGQRLPVDAVAWARAEVPSKLLRLMQQCFDQVPSRRPAAAEAVKQLLLVREEQPPPAAALGVDLERRPYLVMDVEIRLSPGRSLTFRWLLLEDFSDGSNAGAGLTLVEPGDGVTEVVIDRCAYIAPRCFTAAFLSIILTTFPRVEYYPGAHILSGLPGVPDVLRAAGTAGDGDGNTGPPGPCIADSSAPPLQRCWAQVLAYEDLASWTLKPGRLLSNIVNRQTQAVALCLELATPACVKAYGPTECLMSGFEAYMAQRLNGSGTGGGIGTSPEPQVPGSNGGTVSAASNSGGAEGLSRAQIAVVVCASTAGALVLLAVAVVGSVWLHRNWRLKRQPKAADDDSSGQATPGPCAGHEASGGGGGAGTDVGASSGSGSAKGSLKPRFEESSLDSTVAAAGAPTTAAATRYLMPDLEAPAVLPMSPCHAPFVSIVDEVMCQPPGQPPPPPEPASTGEGVIAGDVTPAGSVVSARAEERQPGEDEVMLLQRVLGMGAFGKVYEGLYRGERVAVKVFTSFMGPGFPSHLAPVGSLQSLVREVEVLGRVSHPNVVRLLAACVMPPRMGLVLELMETSLSRLMYKMGPPHAPLLPIDEVLTIATHVAAGLAYLHPTIVHRDLKPANVLISGYGTPQLVAKLADFGLSRLRSTTVATEHPEAGTAAYLAPECYDIHNCYVTHDADMYSFGVLLWEMLMGREPWQGLPVMVIATKIQLHGERLPVDAVAWARGWAEVPPKLLHLLHQCFDQVPSRRPAAAEAVKQLLLVREELAHLAAADRSPAVTGASSGLQPQAQPGPALQAQAQVQAQAQTQAQDPHAEHPYFPHPNQRPPPAAALGVDLERRPYLVMDVEVGHDEGLWATAWASSQFGGAGTTEQHGGPSGASADSEHAVPRLVEAVGERW